MKIFIVYDDTLHEGCSQPLAAFSARELADAYAAELQSKERHRTTKYLVEELTMDARP